MEECYHQQEDNIITDHCSSLIMTNVINELIPDTITHSITYIIIVVIAALDLKTER